MCVAPIMLPNGKSVACHECWQCRERAINDWVGRNIAESKTARACHAVTLTYGRDQVGEVLHERAVVLTYSDVQKYLKLLRRHGFPVRYFVTGEFGSRNGRAHWHIMLYWQDGVPPHVLDRNFTEEHWPHGWSHWTRPTPRAIRYNCKYIQKDMGDALRQGHLAMSKKPPLGAAYFASLAESYAAKQLAPQTLEYSWPEVQRRKRDGSKETVEFMLTDRSAELYLQAYVDAWRELWPGKAIPPSKLVEEFLDPGAWEERAGVGRPLGTLPKGKVPHGLYDEVDAERQWERWAEQQWERRNGQKQQQQS